jgi:putative ABC transport system permease protein
MFKNYFKIAWRNIFRHKAYAGINIIGLALGIAACLLILQFVTYELSYDKFHVNKDNLYRITQDRYDNGQLSTRWASGAYAIGNAFKDAFPEIEDYVKLTGAGKLVINKDQNLFKLERPYYAGESFFKLFSYPLLEGDRNTVLKEPFQAVISEDLSQKLFGKEKAIGKIIRLNGQRDYTVSGVYKNFPSNTHLKPDILLSYKSFVQIVGPDNNPDNAWNWDGCLTYVLLKPGVQPKQLEAKFPTVVNQKNGEELKKFNAGVTYHLQPVTDIHLYSNMMMEAEVNGDGKTVYLLLGIAFFIVLIAWVNYINLATARAISRAKEVGIRKAIGSQRGQLILQFLFESALLNALAVLLAFILILIAIPSFNRLTGQDLNLSLLASGNFWITFTGLFILGTFLSGLYPALVLSGFKPIVVLKGKMVNSSQGILLRKSLVVFQFAASLFLLIGTLTVSKQVKYMKNQELGINIEQTLVLNRPVVATDSTYASVSTSFKQTLLKQTGIRQVAASTSIPGEPVGWNAGGIRLISAPENTQKQYRVIGVDYDYIDMFDLKLIAGRKFSKDFGTDPKSVIFNESGLHLLGFTKPEEAVGKQIFFWGDTLSIAGVVSNFHQQSLRDAFEPLILRLFPDVRGNFSIKLQTSDINGTIQNVRKEWNKSFPGNTFDYFFLDDHFNEQYKADQRFGLVFGIFTSMAILVACLGLFGLASFTTIQRTKEIGIRKVLGASVPSILRLLYKEFALLILISFLIATPLAWYANHLWLQGYAFRINMQSSLFIIPLITILLVALLTVSFQTVKAALANPVKSLRTE